MRNWPHVILLAIAFTVVGCFDAGESRESDGGDFGPGGPGSPGSATLSWYPPTENGDGSYLEDLAGYRIYYGRSAKKLDRAITIDNPGLTRYVVENLSPARWHFAMTSVNSRGVESKRSETVSKKIA